MGVSAVLQDIRTQHSPQGFQVVLKFQSVLPVFRVFQLSSPDRVVVDLFQTKKTGRTSFIPVTFEGITGIRSGIQNGYDVRVVVDLTRFQIPDALQKGRDLILTFVQLPSTPPSSGSVIKKPALVKTKVTPKTTPPQSVSAVQRTPLIFKVALDAGHGGSDPGAIGPQGLREKNVTLAIAKKLAKLIRRHPRMKAILIRDSDRFVPLRQRMQIARRAEVDLFVSIHADGFTDPKARGASVFTLSSRGASSEFGLWLAQKENRSDLIGGVSLGDKDEVLASVLLDLSQSATLDASYEMGDVVLRQLKNVTLLHQAQVQQAGFAVLKAPDLPSVLIETGFISNPEWEAKLKTEQFQNELARAIFKGILIYSERKHPEIKSTLYASLSAEP